MRFIMSTGGAFYASLFEKIKFFSEAYTDFQKGLSIEKLSTLFVLVYFPRVSFFDPFVYSLRKS